MTYILFFYIFHKNSYREYIHFLKIKGGAPGASLAWLPEGQRRMEASHGGRYSDFDARAGGGGKSSLTIEPSGGGGHHAGSSGSGGSCGKRNLTGNRSIYSLGTDLLCAIFSLLDHFDLVRCSVVCKAWFVSDLCSKSSLSYYSCIVKQLLRTIENSFLDQGLGLFET